ncbi:MAG TPA: DUF106 domain-containing protein [Candidatus Aenigmarchaeota archaeon]|nr:DUF106 domain-containing protein [Candidatus Aenigmarchaeota archaeon]
MIKNPITGMFDLVFAPVLGLPPFLSLTLLSIFLTCLVLFLNRLFLRKKVFEELKEKIFQLKEEALRLQKEGKMVEMEKCLQKMTKLNMYFMKQTFKTLLISILVFDLFFPWIKYRFSGYEAIARLPFKLPFIGENLNWLQWYIFISLVVGYVLKKILG